MPRSSLLLVLGLYLISGDAIGRFQSITSGVVTGTVSDPSGAPIPAATVTLTNIGTNTAQNDTTSSEGTYRFAFVTPGNYKVNVAVSGFKSQERTGLSVNPGQPITVNVQLAVATASSTVDVVETPAVLQTENADDTTSYTTAMIQDLPDPGGDLTYIAQTAAGVVMATQSGYGNFEANGMPATSNLFTVNGSEHKRCFPEREQQRRVQPDARRANDIAEASVVNNAYSGPVVGSFSGTQVAYVSKSGSNQFHGGGCRVYVERAER